MMNQRKTKLNKNKIKISNIKQNKELTKQVKDEEGVLDGQVYTSKMVWQSEHLY